MIDKEDTLIEIFCDASDFWEEFFPLWHSIQIENFENQLYRNNLKNRNFGKTASRV